MYLLANFSLNEGQSAPHEKLLPYTYRRKSANIWLLQKVYTKALETITLSHLFHWLLTPPGYLVSPLDCRDPWMSTVVLYCWCHSDSASVLLYFTFLPHLFPLPFGAGSTVPREGFDSSVIMTFSWCCGCDTSYIASVHIQFQASIYTLSLCRGH